MGAVENHRHMTNGSGETHELKIISVILVIHIQSYVKHHSIRRIPYDILYEKP